MNRKNYNLLHPLVIFLIIIEIQCAPSPKVQTNPNVYDKLVELSKKCTYLQTTMLAKNNTPQFLKDCGRYEDVHDSKVNVYNLENVHCLLYYDTFSQLCAAEHPDIVATIVTTAAIKSVESSTLANVCNSLHNYFGMYNETKLAQKMVQVKHCMMICGNLDDDEHAMKACSLSALMASTVMQIARLKMESPNIQVKNLKIDQNDNMESVFGETENNPPQQVEIKPKNDEITHKNEEIKQKIEEIKQKIEETKPKIEENKAPIENPAGKPEIPLKIAEKPLETLKTSQEISQNEHISQPIKDSPQIDTKNVENVLPPEKSVEKQTKSSKAIEKSPPEANKTAKTTKITQTTQAQTDLRQPADIPPSEIKVETPKTQKTPETISSKTQNEADINMKQQEAPKIVDNQEDYSQHDENDEENEAFPGDIEEPPPAPPAAPVKEIQEKPLSTNEDEDFNRSVTNDDLPSNDSYFFSYFMMFCILFVMGYVGYHNKQKILALLLEGRRGRRQPRRRPNSANYHKLDSNLEEAVTSSCDKTTSNVIY